MTERRQGPPRTAWGALAVAILAALVWVATAPARRPPPSALTVALGAAGPETWPIRVAADLGPICVRGPGRRRACVRLRPVPGDPRRALLRVSDGLAALSAMDASWPGIAMLAERPALALVARRGYPAGGHFLWHDLTDLTVVAGPGLPAFLARSMAAAHEVRLAAVEIRAHPEDALLTGTSAAYALLPWPEAQRVVARGEGRIALDLARESPPLAAAALLAARSLVEEHPRLVTAVADRIGDALTDLSRGVAPGVPRALTRRLAAAGVWPADPELAAAPWRRLAVLAHLLGERLPPPEGLPWASPAERAAPSGAT